MERLTLKVDNPKFGQPGQYPRVEQVAATVNDMIAELIKIRDEHGNVPVVLTGRLHYCGEVDDEVSNMLLEGSAAFGVHLNPADELYSSVGETVRKWNHRGPVVEVRVDVQ